MTLELERLAEKYARVAIGVVIQQPPEGRVFGDVVNAAVRIREGPVLRPGVHWIDTSTVGPDAVRELAGGELLPGPVRQARGISPRA